MDSRSWHASTNLPIICRSRAVSCAESYGIRTGLNFASCAARLGAITRLEVSNLVASFACDEPGACAPAGRSLSEQANRISRPAHAVKRLCARLGRLNQMTVFPGSMTGILPELGEQGRNRILRL